jgi:hypothetical protein
MIKVKLLRGKDYGRFVKLQNLETRRMLVRYCGTTDTSCFGEEVLRPFRYVDSMSSTGRMNWKGFRRSSCGLIEVLSRSDWEKQRRTSVRISCLFLDSNWDSIIEAFCTVCRCGKQLRCELYVYHFRLAVRLGTHVAELLPYGHDAGLRNAWRFKE